MHQELTDAINRLTDSLELPPKASVAIFVNALVEGAYSKEIFTTVGKDKTKIPGIYGLFRNDELIYIGKSVNVYTRVQNHINSRCGQSKLDGFTDVAVIHMPLDGLELAEYRLIRHMKPEGNTLWAMRKHFWGAIPADDLAELTQTSPGKVLAVCAEHDIPVKNRNIDIRKFIWHFSRQNC